MRVLLQRVSQASVDVEGARTPQTGRGIVALVGFGQGDRAAVLQPMAAKVVQLRIFDDGEGRMNLSLLDVEGDLVLVSQFTLYANCAKGRRPSFIESLPPQPAALLFDRYVDLCRALTPNVTTGRFGATMKVHLINDGPVTILLDSDELKMGTAGEGRA